MSKKNNDYLINIFRLLIILLVAIIFGVYISENFSNNVANVDPIVDMLYPTRKLDNFCEKQGLIPAYMPQKCMNRNGHTDELSNCRCMDKTNTYCEICYKDIHHITNLKKYEKQLKKKFPYMQYKNN